MAFALADGLCYWRSFPSAELSCPFPIYGNPSKSAYQALDLQANLAMTAKGHKKASYLTESNFQQIIGSIGVRPAFHGLSLA
jgi:hypothetical protein